MAAVLLNSNARFPETDRQGHAFDVVKTVDLSYDVIVTVSGDGLVHEVFNGLGEHEQPMKALSIAVAPIPAGSGNGLSLNLLGIEVSLEETILSHRLTPGSAASVQQQQL